MKRVKFLKAPSHSVIKSKLLRNETLMSLAIELRFFNMSSCNSCRELHGFHFHSWAVTHAKSKLFGDAAIFELHLLL